MLLPSPPEAVTLLLEKLGLGGEPVLLAATCDLSGAGQFEEHWLVVTERHLHVLVAGEAPRALQSLSRENIERFRVHGTVGCGFLQAHVDGAWVDLVRYSNGLAHRFAKVAGKLNDFLDGASKNDPAVHERFWADELIYTGSSGRRIGKADIMRDVHAARRGAAFGAILAAFDTGIGTGSSSTGWLIERYGFSTAFGVAAMLSAVALPYFIAVERRLR